MIIYNVTVNIDIAVAEEWKQWMNEKHIPDVLNTGCFTEARMTKVIGEEEGGKTYSIQYTCPSQEVLEKYQREFAPALQQEHTDKYSGKFGAFRTLLEVVKFHEC